jgi:glycerol-3-phosphate dehydrogenase
LASSLQFNNSFPESFSWKDRSTQWQGLVHSKSSFDIVIVGGGITGAAIAREAALLGLKILVVEKGDFASGTSSRSSKLVHGGVRYLEQFEFGLVQESTRERARLWKLAPELSEPLPFLFPAYEDSRVPLWKLNLGLWLYDLLAAFRTPSLHKKYSRKETIYEEPKLRKDKLEGSIFYWDGATDDAKLTLANILDARANGAQILSQVSLESVEWNPKQQTDSNEQHTVRLKNQLNGQEATVYSRVVVSALGPWTDLFPNLTQFHSRPLLKATRGSHIVVPKNKLPCKHAIVLIHPTDGRVLFSIPWGNFTVIGTTDIYDNCNPADVCIQADEVDYLIKAAQHYFPDCSFSKDDIISTWSGLRPLIAPPSDAGASEVSREHHLEFIDPGLVIIAGGKLTTHREMAEQCVNFIFNKTQNWKQPVGPQENRSKYPSRDRHFPKLKYPLRGSEFQLGETEASRFSFDDVAGILRTQMVLHLEDFMVRRTSLFYKEPNNGLDLIPRLKDIFCLELNWDESTWQSQVQAYKDYINKNVRIPTGRRPLEII